MKNIILIVGVISILLVGCVKQPQRISNTTHAQITLINSSKKNAVDYIAMRMIEKEFYIVNQTNYSIDFRATLSAHHKSQNSFAYALMESLDGSEIKEKGVDFFISEYNGKLTIKAKPYLFKTYPYNRQKPKKEYLSNNNEAFNSMQRLLNETEKMIETSK